MHAATLRNRSLGYYWRTHAAVVLGVATAVAVLSGSLLVGESVKASLARLAVARGCGRLEWSVLNWNEPAIRFYETLGAVPMKEWTVYRLTGEALKQVAR